MFDVLKTLEHSQLYQDCGLFYGSIAKTIEHSLWGDIGIFVAKFASFAQKSFDFSSLLSYVDGFTLRQDVFENFDSMVSLQQKADDAIREIITHTVDFDSIATLQFPKLEFKKPRGFLMLAILNHSVHHRGQVAGILDAQKIENDFAGMLRMPI